MSMITGKKNIVWLMTFKRVIIIEQDGGLSWKNGVVNVVFRWYAEVGVKRDASNSP
jgi:hypothetical protein